MKTNRMRGPMLILHLGMIMTASPIPDAAASASTGEARITFHVTVPPQTPAAAPIWISGNAPELGAWNGAGIRLEPLGARSFAVTVVLPAGTALEFKVTRGAWETVEKGPEGEEIPNHLHSVQGDDTIRVVVAKWRDQIEGPARPRPSTRTGDIRVHAAFGSEFVRPRDVLVWLPPGYESRKEQHFPVLYFHDGNNVFDDSTSFAGEWRLDETAERLIRAGRVRPFIAVAIYNTPDRIAEYTPVADSSNGGGRAQEYARFLLRELKPFIDRTYRTMRDPAATGLVGSSLGGLVSIAIAMDHPEAFGLVGSVSPSVWWADRWIVRRAATCPRTLRIWLDHGTAEGNSPMGAKRMAADAAALRDTLLAAGLPGSALHFELVEGAAHNEAAWAARLDRILEFLLWPPGSIDPPPEQSKR